MDVLESKRVTSHDTVKGWLDRASWLWLWEVECLLSVYRFEPGLWTCLAGLLFFFIVLIVFIMSESKVIYQEIIVLDFGGFFLVKYWDSKVDNSALYSSQNVKNFLIRFLGFIWMTPVEFLTVWILLNATPWCLSVCLFVSCTSWKLLGLDSFCLFLGQDLAM